MSMESHCEKFRAPSAVGCTCTPAQNFGRQHDIFHRIKTLLHIFLNPRGVRKLKYAVRHSAPRSKLSSQRELLSMQHGLPILLHNTRAQNTTYSTWQIVCLLETHTSSVLSSPIKHDANTAVPITDTYPTT